MEHAILVGELLAKLTPSERQLCLWKREGLSSAEIARLRGGTATAVDSLWFRIRKKIVMTFP
jgi:DNA-binding CsgD family transcriptional regulator